MHSALAVAAPAAVSELRAQGVLGVGRLRSLAVAVVAIGVSLGCLVAVRSAVGGLNALQLAMFSVGGWALLIANGLSGAYLGGTGTRDVHGIVDHLPLRRVDLAMLPFALGGLRSGILSALLCGIALVAPRSANTPTPLWLSLVVAATLPILPATIVWASTRRQRPYAPAWILLPLTVLISVPMVAEVRLDGARLRPALSAPAGCGSSRRRLTRSSFGPPGCLGQDVASLWGPPGRAVGGAGRCGPGSRRPHGQR